MQVSYSFLIYLIAVVFHLLYGEHVVVESMLSISVTDGIFASSSVVFL